MMNMVRSFFGLNGLSGKRTVMGQPLNVDLQEVQYIKDSNTRLTILHNLLNRYKGTPHEAKFKAVFERTKNIHTYLVSRRRFHDLEMFHVQHTEHFISAFTVILDAHQRHTARIVPPFRPGQKPEIIPPKAAPPAKAEVPAPKPESIFKRFAPEPVAANGKPQPLPEMPKPSRTPKPLAATAEITSDSAALSVPTISIDTYSKVYYTRETSAEGEVSGEICYTSSDAEKEQFLLHLTARLGININGLSYIGNALISLPHSDGSCATSYVPVVYWKGFTYAFNLTDYRLFPVKIYRRSH